MDQTRQPNTPYLIILFFTLTVATQTTGSVNCQTGSLRYPFGFTDGYPIRFNCSEKTGYAEIGEFTVQEVTDANIYVEIPPLCKRDIRKIEHLFRDNYAPSISQNTILVQGCNESSSDCSIGFSFVQDRLNQSRCISQVRCLDAATEIKADVMSVVDVVNGSGCKYWFSSITRRSKSNLLGQLRLDWWLKEGCSNTNTTCSANATCTEIKVGGGGFGHRCTCDDGFYGNAFIVHGGCQPVGKRKGLLHKLIVLGIAVLLGASLIAILIFAFICGHKRSKSSSGTSLANRLFCELAGNSSVPFYTYKELEKATDKFSDKNKLGTGAYGTVYAGEFPNSSWVAIKRLRRKDTPSIDQVVNEIKLLSSLSHPNLVRLLGCCVAQGEPILVYEFMPNGTLSQHLQHERGGHTPLSWPLRLSIASQTANAIAHLHSSVNPPIYHRDIKSSNILLDYEFNSKVSDFGLSRLGMSTDFDVSHISTAPQGTPGYLDPQYHQDFQLSDKSDVYSFGVVLIEIISGFKVIDFTRPFTEVNLAALAIDRIGRGRVVDIVDPSLLTENDPKMFASVQNLAELAFRCLSFHRNMRPTMIEVAEDLQRIKLMYFGKETRNSKNRSDIDIKRLNSK
ncbi:hypothetical protein Bca52824_009989 [Brassica carinata]|uniref:Protein kinase domain-containing protein n=1 Tax=Brassica carinata TaxID=52824 RepID=A0A8X7WCD0_BRACI|nr:hypothetical protein Bca52824_009989 [Brassica carinata]